MYFQTYGIHLCTYIVFVLYKQDIVPLQQQKIGKCFEILLRLKDTNGNIVSPAAFFPIAERYHLSSKIDRWVINAVYEHFAKNKNQLLDIDTIAINLSGHSLIDNELEQFIITKLTDGQLPPTKICFEITETAAITSTLKLFPCLNWFAYASSPPLRNKAYPEAFSSLYIAIVLS